MRPRLTTRWKAWLPIWLLLLACGPILREWLVPEHVASWLLLLSFGA